MKNISKISRIAIVASVIWPLLVLFYKQPWDAPYAYSSSYWEIVFLYGVLPILGYWGFRFVVDGINTKDKSGK